MILDPFYVSKPFADSIVNKRVCRRCPISLYHIVTLVDIVEHAMIDVDVIICMD